MERKVHKTGEEVTYLDFYGCVCSGIICQKRELFSSLSLTKAFHTTYLLHGVKDRIFTYGDLQVVKRKPRKRRHRKKAIQKGRPKRVVRVKTKSQRLKKAECDEFNNRQNGRRDVST